MKNRVCLFLRVSTTKHQDFQYQGHELETYCKEKGYIITHTIATKVSGAKRNEERADIMELLDAAKAGRFDKVVVTELSRLGRRAIDLKNTISNLHKMGVSIVFKNLGGLESLVDGTESLATKIIIAIYGELAESEREMLSMRVKSGMVNAKEKLGKHIGRPRDTKESQEQLLKKYPRLIESLQDGLSIRKAERLHNVSRGTVIKVKRLLAMEG
jgi:DNA invertase Pin-like site-specific DNA recombinase